MNTILTDACRGGPECLPLIHYLLDNGADTEIGWFAGRGALYTTVLHSQPIEVIEIFIDKSSYGVMSEIHEAITQQRPDALRLFFN